MKRIIDESMRERMNVTGSNIRKAREQVKMTQEELSAKLETRAIYVCRGSISRIENGSRVITDIELLAIADALGVPVKQLFDGVSLPE